MEQASHNPGVVVLGAGPGTSGCELRIGTSGYSYLEWVDSGFYPAGTRPAGMLELYARCFSTVELNYTWYQMARPAPLARMAAKAPPHLRFAAKLTRTITHERRQDWREQLKEYRRGIGPLTSRLAAILVQLPPGFDRSIANRRFLAELLDALQGLPVAVEFRHESWAADGVFAELERRRVTLVTVDAPPVPGLFPLLDVVTNPALIYVRLHGRNRQGWRSGNMQKKFDYDYNRLELQQFYESTLVPMVRRAGHGLLYFNNHVGAQAPRNAGLFASLAGRLDG